MIIKKELTADSSLSEEQIAMLKNLKNFPDEYDEDAPYYSKEELQRMRKLAEERKSERHKEVVSLRLSAPAYNKARSLGKGYTSVLSRILEDVLSDSSKIEKYL